MRTLTALLLVALAAVAGFAPMASLKSDGSAVRLITLDPGHFHASLVHKEMYPGVVSPQVHIYAPFGSDLLEHLGRLSLFNTRAENPTTWQLEIHSSPDFFERMVQEKPGNVVMLAGRNNIKIEYIEGSVNAGLNVLADKPWIIGAEDLPRVEMVMDTATKKGLVAYDLMTERYEVTSMLQKELVNDPSIFGAIEKGTPEQPGVEMRSVHYILKLVAGAPNLRPGWFFDVAQQGEGLTDVGTHLVDLVSWTLFQNQPLDYRRDVQVNAAKHWPVTMTREQFRRVTGEKDFPPFLAAAVRDGQLDYFCNGQIAYALKGVNVKLDAVWEYEAPHGDTHLAIYRGSKARVEVHQEDAERYRTELYVIPNSPADRPAVFAAVRERIRALQAIYSGTSVEEKNDRAWISIPDKYRTTHESHFAQVTNRFLKYINDPKSLPAWENQNMLAKYYITTRGREAALGLKRRQSAAWHRTQHP
ncbi:MAG TPA: putative oxidoreductase C-terminal domain-containing protein [Candidatus Dormibacteraeota bacterium]|nr:putative oxidoreductase C-terminal domain-containing protein [Candidatus Dormibacteraeota bacterium]